jgi:hypothetical protein
VVGPRKFSLKLMSSNPGDDEWALIQRLLRRKASRKLELSEIKMDKNLKISDELALALMGVDTLSQTAQPAMNEDKLDDADVNEKMAGNESKGVDSMCEQVLEIMDVDENSLTPSKNMGLDVGNDVAGKKRTNLFVKEGRE